MIDPVPGPSGAREQAFVVFSVAKAVPKYDLTHDTMSFGKNDSSKFFESLKNIFQTVWSWIQFNIFFCFFDEKEEDQKQFTEEIKEYIGVFYDRASVPTKKKQREMVESYNELPSQIKKVVEESIAEILRETRPKISIQKVNEYMKIFLAQPFRQLVDKTKSEKDQKIFIFGFALCRAEDKLKGFPLRS